MTSLQIVILAVAAAGLLNAANALRLQVKLRREYAGRSCDNVLASPHARLLGLPNTVVGMAFYAGVIAAFALPVSWPATGWLRIAAAAAAVAAGGVSVYLLWSLMAVTKMPCKICLAGNAINLFLAGLTVAAVLPR